jgi:hypothetical protein
MVPKMSTAGERVTNGAERVDDGDGGDGGDSAGGDGDGDDDAAAAAALVAESPRDAREGRVGSRQRSCGRNATQRTPPETQTAPWARHRRAAHVVQPFPAKARRQTTVDVSFSSWLLIRKSLWFLGLWPRYPNCPVHGWTGIEIIKINIGMGLGFYYI